MVYTNYNIIIGLYVTKNFGWYVLTPMIFVGINVVLAMFAITNLTTLYDKPQFSITLFSLPADTT